MTHWTNWTNKEVAVLRELYPTAEKSAIEGALPRHTGNAIRARAAKLGLRRPQRPAGRHEHPHPVMRALRARRIALGISATNFAVDLGTERSVLMRYETQTYPNMKRLVEWADLLGFDLKLEACASPCKRRSAP